LFKLLMKQQLIMLLIKQHERKDGKKGLLWVTSNKSRQQAAMEKRGCYGE